MAEEKKKIIIDSDWKQQAQEEKARAEAELKAEKEAKEEAKLPKGDFLSLVSMLSTQAYYALGLIGDPQDENRPEPNLDLARYSIDMLDALEEKTKGNLTEEESGLLKTSLSQLRMIFVKITDSVGS